MRSSLPISSDERAARALTDASVGRAQMILSRDGVLVLEGVFDVALIDAAREACAASIAEPLGGVYGRQNVAVDHERYQVTVEVEGPLAERELIRNSFVHCVAEAALGVGRVLDNVGMVVAKPGAAEQEIHRDHDPLFPSIEVDPAAMPAHALNVIVPLVDLDMESGGTRAWLGSHLIASDANIDGFEAVPMLWPRGCCYMMDYRLVHGGMANTSDRDRPMLYLSYVRPWFVDVNNYATQIPIALREDVYRAMDDDVKQLFSRTPAARACGPIIPD